MSWFQAHWQWLLIIIGAAFVLVMGFLALLAKFYRQVEQGKALVVNTLKQEPIVTFTGAVVYPIVHKAEVMDISVKTIEIDRRGKEGLICKDNIRADIKVTFFVRVSKTREDVLKVAQSIGCARASAKGTIEELFSAKFSEALKTVGKTLEFEELYTRRNDFRDEIIKVIGKDLNGYVLEDAAIDFLEQTSLAALDPTNILDAQGIKKITEITTQQNMKTNDLKQVERQELTRQNVAADEKVFELQRQRADAENKAAREIATVKAREGAETLKIQAEEKARSEMARIKAEENVKVEEENKERQVGVAGKNRERVIAVEKERVERDRMLEQIARERATELQRIEKEKAIEIERKAIADVIRERVAVEKTVAQEEENIKDVRVLCEANRVKEATKLHAEGEALEKLVKETTAAEAREQVAVHIAREQLTMATAQLEAADKQAQAKIRMAEGEQAEHAAEGLANAKVKEADAAATEKLGLANVRVKEADSVAVEKLGLANARVKEADAAALQKIGVAQAEVVKQKLLAEATGEQEKGLAKANVVEKEGLAEATAVREKLVAEATGLHEKAEAMKLLDAVGKDHEEFRLKLDKEKTVELEQLHVRRDVAEAQAKVMAEAMGSAKINIVGGDGQFFDRFVRAVSLGQSMDAAVDHSKVLGAAAKDYLEGDASLAADLKHLLTSKSMSPDAQHQLTVSALLGKLMLAVSPEQKKKLELLAARAKELGIDQLIPG